MSTAATLPVTMPAGLPRLLAGWYDTGRPAGLRDHLRRYGPVPLRGRSRRGMPMLAATVEQAGLAGHGGAWFPAAVKMRSAAAGRGPAVVVANGSESEPASEKDRLLLHVAPHLVLDGAVLAAEAIGADQIFVCVHDDGHLPRWVAAAAEQRQAAGLDPVPAEIAAVPQRYVASEETALVQWLSGGPPLPTFTPPRPYERGVGGRRTLVHNVETLAHLALLARYGPGWFRGVGTAEAPGSALITFGVPTAAHSGVYEVALGTPVGYLFDLAGAPPGSVQALLTGGYGGAWIPVRTDLPLTPGGLRSAGGSLGAGVVIGLPAAACGLAETARVLAWLAGQGAGQCGPCVYGLPAIADDFALLAAGKHDPGILARLRSRLGTVTGRGACHHPDGAVRLAASALSVFASDVGYHLRHGPCRGTRHPPVLPLPGAAPRRNR
ncbi:MAG TPA: NADH-ubiquinone oxidoreductase-F iron-sulfur binding region domain-containing protein [Streptosporangiaceae bacterium]|nr:NADH-ubiquinone oxidoreductase-F iron-sulfur binding region domain-containing protein [Streptosporangiaceae bacterium]